MTTSTKPLSFIDAMREIDRLRAEIDRLAEWLADNRLVGEGSAVDNAIRLLTYRHLEHPEALDAAAYRSLRDVVIDKFNPPDDDGAEESTMAYAVEGAARYIEAQPCSCKPGDEDDPCERCVVLGRWHDIRIHR